MEAAENSVVLYLNDKKSKALDIGEIIKNKRAEKGWSQTRLSEVAGLSQGIISLMENKGESLTDENLTKVAAALEIAVSELTASADAELIKYKESELIKQQVTVTNKSPFQEIAEAVVQRFLEENHEKITKEIEEQILKDIRKTYF
jgi:transcriptional regulator with XRE-family HTH domain